MGLEIIDFNKSCTVDMSPNTVLPSHQHYSKIEKKNVKGKPKHKDDLLRVKEGFTEISFRRYSSSSCKSIPSRPAGPEGNVELRRGSIYQSSREVRKMKKMGTIDGRRKKIEMLCSSDASLSFRIADSLCSSDEENSQKGSPVLSLNSNLNSTSVSRPYIDPCLSDGFIEICPNLGPREKHSSETVRRDPIEDQKWRCDEVVGPLNDGNDLLERDTVPTLHKSHSAKVEMPFSPSLSESDHSSRASSKARFGPIRKMLDPFMKSKSLRSPLGYIAEHGEAKTTGMENMRRNRTFRKSLLHDFSHTAQNTGFDSHFVKKDQHHLVVAYSPVHLHGRLKLENKNGVPVFKFSLDCPEDVFVAKTWKTDNAFKWVYTFHTVGSRKKSAASGWGSNDSNKGSSMVGQMQVSCYLSSELKDGVVFDNSMVTEFVLYDIGHASKNSTVQESDKCSTDVVKPLNGSNPGAVGGNHELDDGSDAVKTKHQPKHASYNSNLNSSYESKPHPWTSADLHPNLEIAAIVIQVPFEKRESLKYRREDKSSDGTHSNLLNLSMVEPRRKDLSDSKLLETVKVVIPTGNHGLPSAESRGPSSVLDRWRLGGGCDCGGWDMACPLTVFGNPYIQCADDQPLVGNQQPLELFVQGAKEKAPALTMTVVEEGQYTVDFHAQLSTLQAFSICVAILHGTPGSPSAGQERSIHFSQLKVLIEEEVKFLIEAAAEEKKNVTKTVEEIPPSFVLNPPFSPISRV